MSTVNEKFRFADFVCGVVTTILISLFGYSIYFMFFGMDDYPVTNQAVVHLIDLIEEDPRLKPVISKYLEDDGIITYKEYGYICSFIDQLNYVTLEESVK